MDKTDDGAWFAPKRYGLGAGQPLTWQGWATFGLNGALIAAGVPLLQLHRTGALPGGREHLVFAAYVLILMLAFLPVYAAKTRGGLRWRWDGVRAERSDPAKRGCPAKGNDDDR